MSIIPTATCRLQFHRSFTFAEGRQLVPYLARLGISHVYASPIFRAAPGSTHGYDVCDHNEINPEIGSREELAAFATELQAHGLGLILDFVPNHMGIEQALNPWWRDVLENGSASPYARFFDIEWNPVKAELADKVLLPVLAEQYGRTLESGGFRIVFAAGGFHLSLSGFTLPLALDTTVPLLRKAVEILSPAPAELESIITAIQHLPLRSSHEPEKVAERARESAIIRDRLLRLCTESNAVESAILSATEEWNHSSDSDPYERLDKVINEQSYRLSSWRVAGEEINYRRFFDVNGLAAIRIELPEVFDAAHRLIFDLLQSGQIQGIRIDHIDGLAYPADYLTRLREKAGREFYLVVEKILAADEKLRSDWPVEGTTGYEFGNQLAQVLASGPGVDAVAEVYDRFLGFKLKYREVAYRCKKLVMETMMASELNVLGHLLNRISESHRWYRDFTLDSLTVAVRELIACFPVYRTYLDPAKPAEENDSRIIHRALSLVRRRNPAMERTVLDFLRDVLLPPAENPHPVDEELRRIFVVRFQQCTGPITAKGLEDTAFYAFNRLVAFNEVGGDPITTGIAVEGFHAQNSARLASHPHNLLATSTHDTKRSEDVRARLLVLSELPEEWGRAVRRWHTINRKHLREIDGEAAPDANEEYLLYQALVGAWPQQGLHAGNRDDFTRRLQEYMVKALREAKVNSSWHQPNETWESAVCDFVAALLAPASGNHFPKSMATFASRIARHGAVNSLTQVVLKCTCPGVPDIYQGTELWDLSLVDPDNRRPVDFTLRKKYLDSLATASAQELFENWKDGRIKLLVLQRLLELRRQHEALFTQGSYAGVVAQGLHAEKVIAFERRHEGQRLLIVTPRHCAAMEHPPVGSAWGDTRIHLPLPGEWRDVFTGQAHEIVSEGAVSQLFSVLPVAVLISE